MLELCIKWEVVDRSTVNHVYIMTKSYRTAIGPKKSGFYLNMILV
jgi:hypothetical protein